MTRRKLIAIDIDDVLSFSARGFTEFSNQTWGTKLEPHDFNEDLSAMWQVSHDVAVDRLGHFLASDLALRYEHDASAVPVLDKLRLSYDLATVTSRSRPLQQMTEQWLEDRYPGVFKAIHFSGIYDNDKTPNAVAKTKIDVFRELQPDYVIDDHLKHCLAAAELGIQSILFGNYRWNQATNLPENVVRCANWLQVGDYFDAQ